MIFYSSAGDTVSFDEDAFTQNSEKLIGLYQSLGVKQVTFEIMSQQQLSKTLQLVSVVWHFKTSAGAEIYNATTRYVIRNTESGLKIKSVFVVDETSKVSQLKSA